MSKTPVFDPAEVPESNATTYPPPYHQDNLKRFNRRLGDHAALTHYGVVLTRIVPGGQSSHRHAHSTQDEFVYVLEGTPRLETDEGAQDLRPGMCAGFPAGNGNAHRFVNRSASDVLLLVVGDRSPGDDVTYPDVDMHLKCQSDGSRRFFRKDGRAY
ncbi:MAG: cupin domain-containing protein [Rhizomicrobium sp.]